MKAAVYEGIEKMVIKEVDKPKCTEDNIVIRVKACAICGTDIRTYHHGKKNVKPPQIIGHEIAGIVDEAGKNVKGLKKGDRVSILSEGRNDWIFSEFAVLFAGGISVPISVKLLEPSQLRLLFSRSGSRYAVVSGKQLEKVLRITKDLPELEKIIVLDPSGVGSIICWQL